MDDTTTVVRLILASGRVLSAADHVKHAHNTEESFIRLHNDLRHILYSFNHFLDDLYSSASNGPLQQWFANKYPQGCLDALAEMEARISGVDSTAGTVNEIHSTIEYFAQHRALFQPLLDTRQSPNESNVAQILTKDGTSAHTNESQEFEVPSTREGSLSDFGTGSNESLPNPDASVGQSDDNGHHHSAEGPGTPPHEQPVGPNNKTSAGTRQQNKPLSDRIKKLRPRKLLTGWKARGFLQPKTNSIPPSDTRYDDPLQTETLASLSNRPEIVVGATLSDFTRGDEQPVPDNETPSISSRGATDQRRSTQINLPETPTSHLSWSWSDLLCFLKRAERIDGPQNQV